MEKKLYTLKTIIRYNDDGKVIIIRDLARGSDSGILYEAYEISDDLYCAIANTVKPENMKDRSAIYIGHNENDIVDIERIFSSIIYRMSSVLRYLIYNNNDDEIAVYECEMLIYEKILKLISDFMYTYRNPEVVYNATNIDNNREFPYRIIVNVNGKNIDILLPNIEEVDQFDNRYNGKIISSTDNMRILAGAYTFEDEVIKSTVIEYKENNLHIVDFINSILSMITNIKQTLKDVRTDKDQDDINACLFAISKFMEFLLIESKEE